MAKAPLLDKGLRPLIEPKNDSVNFLNLSKVSQQCFSKIAKEISPKKDKPLDKLAKESIYKNLKSSKFAAGFVYTKTSAREILGKYRKG